MYFIEKLIAQLPVSEISIKTSLTPYAAAEFVEEKLKWNKGLSPAPGLAGFEAKCDDLYFIVQGVWNPPENSKGFETDLHIEVPFRKKPVRWNQSVKFYGRIRPDDENGAVITGHFGIPIPTFLLLCSVVFFGLTFVLPGDFESYFSLGMILLIFSIACFPRFVLEREKTVQYLKRLLQQLHD